MTLGVYVSSALFFVIEEEKENGEETRGERKEKRKI